MAPPGYGKTTLAAEWLDGRDAAWYRATPASADVAGFAAGLCDSLSRVMSTGTQLKQRLKTSNAEDVTNAPLAELLARDLAAWPPDAWLVVDDYQLAAASEAVERFVEYFIAVAPVRILITTRVRPRWLSARRVMYGEILELTREELMMTDAEAADALRCQPPAAAAALIDRAAGWPALLGLAALTRQAEVPEDRLSDVLFRFLAEEVLRDQTVEVRDFMLAASLLDVVDVPTAEAVIEVARPAEVLESLHAQGLVELIEESFRFHPLLQDFLQRRIRLEDPDRARSIYERAIGYEVDAGHWDDAFALASRASLRDVAIAIVVKATPSMLATGRVETLRSWLAAIRDSGADAPELGLVRAELLLRRGRFVEALRAATDVAERLGDDHPLSSRANLVAGQAAHFVADDPTALVFHGKAEAAASTRAEVADAAWGALLASGALELDEAHVHLNRYEAAAAPTVESRLRALDGRQIVAGLQGSYGPLLPILQQMWILSKECDDPMVRTNAQSTVIWLLTMRGEYKRGLRLAEEALQYAAALQLDFATVFLLVLRASAEVGLRRIPAARATLGEVRRSSAWVDDPYLQTADAILELKISIAEGMVTRDLDSRFDPPRRHFAEYGEYLAVRAIVHAGVGDPDAARSAADRADEVSRVAHIRFASKFARLLAEFPQVDSTSSCTSDIHEWSDLIATAADAGCLDPFVMTYRIRPDVLRIAHWDDGIRPVIIQLVRATRDVGLGRNAGIVIESTSSTTETRLTRREREVADLMCAGYTNAEIAQRLVISLSTAKVHARNVLRKTRVRSRVELAAQSHDPLVRI